MNERQAVERVMERVYKDRLRQTGRLPDAREQRLIEKTIRDAAESADKKKKRG
ncbi:MAG: hypothetical protein AABY51_09560 [Deltaproteobacteria bacterium]